MRTTRSRIATAFLRALSVLAITAIAISFALAVAPHKRVTVAGQRVTLGLSLPQPNLSGPATIETFGHTRPTPLTLNGPVRPELRLSSLDRQEIATKVGARPAGLIDASASVAHPLISGWLAYALVVALISAVSAAVLSGIVLWPHRRSFGRWLARMAGVALVTVVAFGGLLAPTAASAIGQSHRIHSLGDLVGSELSDVPPPPVGPVQTDVTYVAIGDSVSAGFGNPLASDASPEDRLCDRSPDAFAGHLEAVTGKRVLNLSCSSATMAAGLIGPQRRRGQTLPPQLGRLAQVKSAEGIVVSIGANDVFWSDQLRACVIASCNDNATADYFKQSLDRFTADYDRLLRMLTRLQSELPRHPMVVINLYYKAVTSGQTCAEAANLPDDRIAVLQRRQAALNEVLSDGARAADFAIARPNFTGHTLCSPEPFVFDLSSPGRFHPNLEGQQRIAAADLQALLTALPAADSKSTTARDTAG